MGWYQSFREKKNTLRVTPLKIWRLPIQLIIFPEFSAKISDIARPVNYSFLPSCGHVILYFWVVRKCTCVILSWKFRHHSDNRLYLHYVWIVFFICLLLPPLLSLKSTQFRVASLENVITYIFIWHDLYILYRSGINLFNHKFWTILSTD